MQGAGGGSQGSVVEVPQADAGGAPARRTCCEESGGEVAAEGMGEDSRAHFEKVIK